MSGMTVDVYPVGWLSDIRHAWRCWTDPKLKGHRRKGLTFLHRRWKYTVRQARRRNWRAVRQAFNGYLAEPDEFPPGDYRRRCGTGWTKRGAVRSLRRRLPAGAAGPWDG
jgi:hypothetical protein